MRQQAPTPADMNLDNRMGYKWVYVNLLAGHVIVCY